MEEIERDMIVGIHSIAEVILNSSRDIFRIVSTEEGLKELVKRSAVTQKDLDKIEVKLIAPHALQEVAKKIYKNLDMNYSRVPSGIFIEATPLQFEDLNWIYKQIEDGKKLRIFCLDQVTDIHNGAAIMRTAAFYGVDCLVTAVKGSFGMGPNFSRIASGAAEHVKIVKCGSLPKFLTKLKQQGIGCIGFSEHSDEEATEVKSYNGICLVMGSEDTGLSNAVERVLDKRVAFVPQGPIKSLNVSVAAAIAMEKFFK
jgi:23S rRNA (guanosine2251-2'-O)-methyltransferase